MPGLRMLLIVTPQKMQQSPIEYFCFPIYLWMECYIPLKLSVHLLPKCSIKGTKISSVKIRDDASWYPKVHPDLFKEQDCCFLSLDGLFTRHKNSHFDETVNYQE
jgi:hypothetical protein